MIIATAGHVDHGKTTLVRALTGVDTDRLPEEKKRGLTIDIGFAYEEVEPGVIMGFVDVPGHERFVKNMLAGVATIDFALLVVAADDGVMPQTEEHLAILACWAFPKALSRSLKSIGLIPKEWQRWQRKSVPFWPKRPWPARRCFLYQAKPVAVWPP
jgi:selenocysteine-specific translation elongation factor